MLKTTPFVVLSLLGGAIVPLQLAIIQALRQSSGASPIQATVVLYAGGLLASVVLAYVISGAVVPPTATQSRIWMWTPGLLGALYIVFMFMAAPKIGAANTLLWVFLGQMLFATLVDSTGWLGMPVREVSLQKCLGLGLIVAGGLVMIAAEIRRG